jgi:hypothetical protein
MKIISTLIAAASLLLANSCKRSETLEPNKDTKALYERFHGKYKVVSSVSSEPIDLNRDGTLSTNLLTELDLQNSPLEIRIRDHFLFSQFWPEAYPLFSVQDTAVNYANQGVTRTFEFDKDIKRLYITPESPLNDPIRFPVPLEVLIKTGDNVEVTSEKRVFSATGWKVIIVVTLYERYTMST